MSPVRRPDLALALNVAPLSLQRELAQEALGYARLLAECPPHTTAMRSDVPQSLKMTPEPGINLFG
jgi:hypothetical protein